VLTGAGTTVVTGTYPSFTITSNDAFVGTVTSVSWTGGIVSVATPTTTPAFTIAGTSGGVPYFSSGTAWASSGVLTASRIVLGGGAGAAPTVLGSLGTTTTVLHGNAAGAPTFGAVSLTADVSGILPVANGGNGLGVAYTVATLPAAGTQGRRSWVTDALAPVFLAAPVGGGAVVCPVFDNGIAWVVA
jgi:hypothetical protein